MPAPLQVPPSIPPAYVYMPPPASTGMQMPPASTGMQLPPPSNPVYNYQPPSDPNLSYPMMPQNNYPNMFNQ